MAKLDLLLTNNDITFTDAEIDMVTGADQVKQEILIRLRLFRSEWFLAPDDGVPYWQQVFDKAIDEYTADGTQGSSARLIESVLRAEILAVDSVEAITEWEMAIDAATRHMTLSFTCSTGEGVVVVSEIFP